jgi:hypothetical protein
MSDRSAYCCRKSNLQVANDIVFIMSKSFLYPASTSAAPIKYMAKVGASCSWQVGSSSAGDASSLRLTFGLVLLTNFCCAVYASISARGLYHDGVAYLFRIAEHDKFFLVNTARTTVDVLRQTPIVLLSNFSSMSLFQRGQVFTVVLLTLPTILCALCWFVVPRNRKAFILFPVTYLLVGFSATSTHGIGEAAVAVGYFWILLFVFLFRTYSTSTQALFWLLVIPAFQLHEGCFPLTAMLLLACAMRWRAAKEARERLFVGFSALLFVAIFVYQIFWIIYPQFPADRAGILRGLAHFEFLYVDGHFNLPLVTGTLALAALAIVFFARAIGPPEKAEFIARTVTVVWAVVALAAIIGAISSEASFSPFAQLEARYQPVFVSAALGTIMLLLMAYEAPDRIWMNSTTIVILISLCVAQATADVEATRRWSAFVADLQSRLGTQRGLVSWEAMLHTGDERRDINWHLMSVEWTIGFTSIVFAPTNRIKSMIDFPVGVTYRPVDPEKPDQLPVLRGIDYSPYRQFFRDQKLDIRP